jgi:hypothetical protein
MRVSQTANEMCPQILLDIGRVEVFRLSFSKGVGTAVEAEPEFVNA